MSEQPPEREDSEAGSYDDLQAEVDRSFNGKWDDFLKAVANPAEVLFFVLWNKCSGKASEIEAWAKDVDLPPDWLPRFYGMLTPKGEFRPGVVTSAPKHPPQPPAAAEGDTTDDAE